VGRPQLDFCHSTLCPEVVIKTKLVLSEVGELIAEVALMRMLLGSGVQMYSRLGTTSRIVTTQALQDL